MDSKRLVGWHPGAPSKACPDVWNYCPWRVVSQASLMLYSIPVYRECVLGLQNWVFQKCFWRLRNLHSGSFVLYATDRSLIQRQPPPPACNSCPPSVGQRRQMIFNFSCHLRDLLAVGGPHSPGRCDGTCRRLVSFWSRSWGPGGCLGHPKRCDVPVFSELCRDPLAAVTRFPLIKIGFWTLSSRQMPALK